MARNMRFDDQDKRALRALDDDFLISTDGETAAVAGEMEVEIVRPADDDGALLLLPLNKSSAPNADP